MTPDPITRLLTRLCDLRPGDVIDATGEVVEHVDHFGPLVIVDFADPPNTSTPTLPAGATTYVRVVVDAAPRPR